MYMYVSIYMPLNPDSSESLHDFVVKIYVLIFQTNCALRKCWPLLTQLQSSVPGCIFSILL